MKSNFAPHSIFCLSCGAKLPNVTSNFAVLTQARLSLFTLFLLKLDFVAIYPLLHGAKMNPKVLIVEQKWQISCMSSLSYHPPPPHHHHHCQHSLHIFCSLPPSHPSNPHFLHVTKTFSLILFQIFPPHHH